MKSCTPAAAALCCTLGLALGAGPVGAQQGAVSDAGSVIISRDASVAPGETLRDIAFRELGRRGLAGALAEFNGIAIDAPLTPGQIVRIPINVRDRGESASVIFVKGDVRINGELLDATTLIVLGDVIETGTDGFLSMEFSNGSSVNLQPESSATLQRLSCLEGDTSCIIEIETTAGELSSDMNRRDGQPLDYRVITPYASAAVRGTVFEVIADPANLIVAVTEGEVDVGALGASVGLDEGFGSLTAEGQAPGQPVALLPAPAFRSVPSRVTAGDSVLWWPLTEVESYTAGLSLDSENTQVVAMIDAEGDRLDLAAMEGVEAGDYFLFLRGVDDDGIPGFVSNTRVVVADVDADLPAPQVAITREGNDTLVSVLDVDAEANGFEIQLSVTEDFDDPLSVDVGPTGSALFRLDADVVFARARQLQDPRLVSAYGDISELR